MSLRWQYHKETEKNIEKGIDKKEETWYNIKAVAEKAYSAQHLENWTMQEKNDDPWNSRVRDGIEKKVKEKTKKHK